MKKSSSVVRAVAIGLLAASCLRGPAQISFSTGNYSINFDTLATTSSNWTNNVTLAGWYASKGNGNATNYIAGTGAGTAGGIYSFGVAGTHPNSERALGSLAGSSVNYAFGVRFSNDTASSVSNISVSYTGEQWRSGGENTPHILAFSCRVDSLPITNSYAGGNWSNFPALNFVSPTPTTAATALDGNAATNRVVFSSVVLTGVVVHPGQELFLRWLDVDNSGFDDALALDDLTVAFGTVPPVPPFITEQPQSRTVAQGDNVTFTVVAGGTPPPVYQWRFFNTNLAGATSSTLTLTNVTPAQSGDYFVMITNPAGTTNSQPASLEVQPQPDVGFSLVTYNVGGNDAADWSTNAPQVRAIARMLQHLNPDIVTFNEIPHPHTNQMPNWITAFFPGYQIVISPGSDLHIHTAIMSRHPIARFQNWLDGAQLEPWGYTEANFTRDLLEAEIVIPSFSRPLHVFTVHLKSSGTNHADAALKRAAEAAAITNWFATNFFVLYPNDPYTLSGDMNEADTDTLAIQRLLSPAMNSHLTNPSNPVTGRINTFSTSTPNPSSRIDYIFPCGLLSANIAAGQVFRSMVLTNPAPPPPLLTNDEKTASDHLPVMMVFQNPYSKPFHITSLTRSNLNVALQWESVFGQPYQVEVSSNLNSWSVLASNLTATSNTVTLATNVTGDIRFFRVHRVP